MNEIKFRAICKGEWVTVPVGYKRVGIDRETLSQYTGLKDQNGVEIYIGDICEFENEDRFIVCMEDWLEVYADWIGEPECEDQTRDLYRIGRSKVIGNIYENKELIK